MLSAIVFVWIYCFSSIAQICNINIHFFATLFFYTTYFCILSKPGYLTLCLEIRYLCKVRLKKKKEISIEIWDQAPLILCFLYLSHSSANVAFIPFCMNPEIIKNFWKWKNKIFNESFLPMPPKYMPELIYLISGIFD